MNSLWQNGHWRSPHDFTSAPSDRALLHGLGLFETFLALDGQPIFLPRHLARLQKSSETLAWQLPSFDYAAIARELLVRNHLASGPARCRLTLSAGSGTLGDLSPGDDFSVWMSAQPLAESPATASACLAPWPRNEHSPLAGLKCSSYAENVLALDHARRRHFDQAIFLNTAGHLCEAATANLFLVTQGALHTPPLHAGCLPGITREVLLELATTLAIPCHQDPLPPSALHSADEIFLSSSLQGILPITRLENRTLEIGPITRQLQSAYPTWRLSR